MQRLQRFATYGHLKQMVLRMITDEIDGMQQQLVGGAGEGSRDGAGEGGRDGGDERGGIDLKEMRALFTQLDSLGQGRVAGLELAQGMWMVEWVGCVCGLDGCVCG